MRGFYWLTTRYVMGRFTAAPGMCIDLCHVKFESLIWDSDIESARVPVTGSMHSKRQSFCIGKARLPVIEMLRLILPKCAPSQGGHVLAWYVKWGFSSPEEWVSQLSGGWRLLQFEWWCQLCIKDGKLPLQMTLSHGKHVSRALIEERTSSSGKREWSWIKQSNNDSDKSVVKSSLDKFLSSVTSNGSREGGSSGWELVTNKLPPFWGNS